MAGNDFYGTPKEVRLCCPRPAPIARTDSLVDYRWHSTRTNAGVAFKLHELRHYFASGPHRSRM